MAIGLRVGFGIVKKSELHNTVFFAASVCVGISVQCCFVATVSAKFVDWSKSARFGMIGNLRCGVGLTTWRWEQDQ